MVRQDCFISARALTARMRNLYGMKAGRKAINNRLLSRVQQRCQAYRIQAGGGSVHILGTFHSGAKSPLVVPDRYLTGEPPRSILWNTLVPFARHHFGDNHCYKDDNATPNRARAVLDFLQQGNVTKMEQSVRTYLGWIGQCNHQYGQPAPET